MTSQPAGFTAGTVASTALPFGQMAPVRSHVPAWHWSLCPRPVRAGALNRWLRALLASGGVGQPSPSHLIYRLLRLAIAKLLICACLLCAYGSASEVMALLEDLLFTI